MHTIQYGTKQIRFSIANRKRKSIAVEVHPDTSKLLWIVPLMLLKK